MGKGGQVPGRDAELGIQMFFPRGDKLARCKLNHEDSSSYNLICVGIMTCQ